MERRVGEDGAGGDELGRREWRREEERVGAWVVLGGGGGRARGEDRREVVMLLSSAFDCSPVSERLEED